MTDQFFIGFDIGGSAVKAALVQNKKIITSSIVALPTSMEGLLGLLKDLKRELITGIESKLGGIGFAVAGTLDVARSKMLNSPNIKYLNSQPIKDLFEQIFDSWQIKIDNDAHCFLLAEVATGAARGLKNAVLLTLGTGIGGALLIDGKIILGSHGAAGEIGHMIMQIEKGLDFEDLAANKFIQNSLGISVVQAYQRAQAGDKKSIEIFGQLGQNLGMGLASIINILDPEAIILSGGVIIGVEDLILPAIQKGIEKYVTSPAARETKILFSELGQEGGALGAALLFE